MKLLIALAFVAILSALAYAGVQMVRGRTGTPDQKKAMARALAWRAFEQAFSVSPAKVAKDPAVLCEYADVLAMQQGGRLGGKPLQVVMQALELDRRQPMALEMAGSAAYEEGRFTDAARYWSDLLPQLRPGSRRHTELTAAIGRAREKADLSSQ